MSLQKDPENIEGKTLQRLLDMQGKRILEVGCGEGRLTWKYAPASSSTIGFDPDHSALRVARADSPNSLNDKVRFVCASANHIPFFKETFDIAILAWSL